MKYIILVVLIVITLILVSCTNEGVNSREFEWHSATLFPNNFNANIVIAGEAGEFFISGISDDFADGSFNNCHVLYRYKSGELTELIRKETDEEFWEITNANYSNGVYWASASKRIGDHHTTTVIRVIGDKCEEFPTPDVNNIDINLVVSRGINEAYFFNYNYDFEYWTRWKFIDGQWETYDLPDLPFGYRTSFIFDDTSNAIYAYKQNYNEPITCGISTDYFTTYVEEEVMLSPDCPITQSDIRFTGSTIHNGKIFFTAQLLSDTRIWYAIIERSGIPGSGVYRVIYRHDKQLGDLGIIVAPNEDEVFAAVYDKRMILHYKEGSVELKSNPSYSIGSMVIKNGIIWAYAGQLDDNDDTFFSPDELIYHTLGE